MIRFISFLLFYSSLSFAFADSSAPKILVETVLKTNQSWDGTTLPSYPIGQPEITLLKITIPPHSALPLHYHPVINAGIILKGELSVTKASGEILNLKAGDSIAELVNQLHYGKNPGDEPVELIVFYAGIEGEPITVLDNNHE